MKPSPLILSVLVIAPLASYGDTVFLDTFGDGSTLNTANTTPIGNTTGYQIASTKSTSGSSMAPGDLKLTFGSTSSGIAEIQALFTSSPITLATPGDSISLSINFVNTSGLLIGGSSFISGGLYNAYQVAPVPSGGLASSGIGAGTTFPTGYAQHWVGYIGRINGNGNNSVIATRPDQTGAADNTAQDLIGNNFSATGAYHTPAGTSLHSKASAVGTLGIGDSFNFTLTYTLGSDGNLTITDSLTDLTTATSLFTDSTTTTAATLLTTTFDGFAFGDRTSTAGVANTMDISQILITDNLQTVPEPSMFTLAGLGLTGLVLRLRRR